MPIAIDAISYAQLHEQLVQCEADGNAMAAENARLRAALTAFVSAWQTSTRPPEGVEFEAIELCGGMSAIRAYMSS